MPEKLISFEDVSYRYEGATELALKNISLDINAGEFVLLMGTSGSGKSTLCQAINGIIPHVIPGTMKGKVFIDGRDTSRVQPAALSRRVGMVFQDPETQLFSLVVEDEVAMSLENRAVPRDEMNRLVDWALDVTSLAKLRLGSTVELSGGQKQRLATAAALASGAGVIILDEPTAYLDNEGTRSILNVVRELCRREGKTVILVEHKIEHTLEFADRVVVMSDGGIVKDGKPAEVLSDVPLMTSLGARLPVALDIAAELGVDVTTDPPFKMEDLRSRIQLERIEEHIRARLPARVSKASAVEGQYPEIEIDEAYFAYRGGKDALRGVSLRISRGEYVAILGRNGAGKSSLAGLMMGLLRPRSGRVIVDGIDTAHATVAEMAKNVGFLMQNPDHQLFTDTVADELAFGPRNIRLHPTETSRLVNESLDLIGLSKFRDTSPYDLSMGQRLRVALAASLILRPPILLLDEPTIGQDMVHLAPLMKKVDELNREGRTIVMITHDSHLASLHAHRAILLNEGEIFADGDAVEVLGDTRLTAACGVEAAPLPRALRELGAIQMRRDAVGK